ncbi:MAG TPA: 4Fe-4S binding protein, partial [Chitinophagales bacterium]|nr:4Fe-4S binding protein [Chitinophagales bacterium]
MAIRITDECINCGACEPECPNNAIYEGGIEWALSDGTSLKGSYALWNGNVIDAEAKQKPVSNEVYFIVTD